jgi:hypothetical protein
VKKVLADIQRVYPDYDPKQGYSAPVCKWRTAGADGVQTNPEGLHKWTFSTIYCFTTSFVFS